MANFKQCSICRQPVLPKDIHPLSFELKEAEVDSAPAGSAAASSSPAPVPKPSTEQQYCQKYGTKLAAVAKKLCELRLANPRAKVILFVQFDDLKRKVGDALTEFGIANTRLQGGTSQRGNIIRDWQENGVSSTFVLLLSLAQSASGTNLTAASHVVFLHPMLAASVDLATQYELQAIGRARRHGQLNPCVHVWRFVTANTIEQAITEQHQAALWASDSAREEAFAAAAAAVAAAAPAAAPAPGA